MERPNLVIFDLGNVIVHVDNLAVAGRLGKTSEDSRYHDPVVLFSEIKGKSSSLLYNFDTGRITPRDFFEGVTSTYRLRLSFAEFVEIWNSGFCEDQDVSSLIRQLARHVRVFLLSNTNSLHYEYLQSSCAVVKEMEKAILSYQVGCMKPAAAIYEHTLEVAGLPAERVWYVDDTPEFVGAASSLGIHGIQFHSATQLKGELAAILNSD